MNEKYSGIGKNECKYLWDKGTTPDASMLTGCYEVKLFGGTGMLASMFTSTWLKVFYITRGYNIIDGKRQGNFKLTQLEAAVRLNYAVKGNGCIWRQLQDDIRWVDTTSLLGQLFFLVARRYRFGGYFMLIKVPHEMTSIPNSYEHTQTLEVIGAMQESTMRYIWTHGTLEHPYLNPHSAYSEPFSKRLFEHFGVDKKQR